MNRNTLCTILVVVLALCFAGCSSNNPELGGGGHGIQIAFLIAPPAQMNEGQVAGVAATVTGDTMNGGVDWSCSTTGATPCGAANFSATHTASGVSTNFTAPAGVETVTITATSTSDNTKSVSANVNVVVAVATTNYTFYLTGQEAINGGPNFYSLAGTVSIDTNFMVTAGVQDYNDANGITSPEPGGDAITGGTLTVNAGGQGTLTLVTNNPNVGVGGTETLGVQFANINHALIIQFDGTATSSGSLDLQTLPAILGDRGYAFTLSGVDFNYNAVSVGGVFAVGGGGLITTGTLDINDNGSLTQGQSFTGMVNAADPTFGRGTINFSLNPQNLPGTVVYYVVNSNAIRIIDVDPGDSAIGSAFSQGAGGFTNASLGNTVFALADNPFSSEAGAVGMFVTLNTGNSPADFEGVGEDSELGNGEQSSLAATISGTYNIMSNGYGNMTVSGFSPGNVFALGIYLTDPTLNLNDPNNPVGGGGAVVLDLDDSLSGMAGVLTPQTDPATSSFAGSYAAGFQDYNNFTTCTECEFDMVAQGSVTAGAISFTALVSDPFETLSGGNTTFTGATLTGTPLPDGGNLGRYSMLSSNLPPNPLEFSFDDSLLPLNVVIYQASGGQLFWLDFDLDSGSVFVGPLEAQVFGGASKIGKKKAAAQTKPKH